ncbi:L-seryl-tRNA(Sec) selenium transferase [Candidatus Marinimicrobia bacterium MT.SAG.4]|nr:L-seryl-tRNA(Sec) selenium transferase [Candidatus Marinimicrobia bacterium MT.SAG.4]
MREKKEIQEELKSLPSVDALLLRPELKNIVLPHELVLSELRASLEEERQLILNGERNGEFTKEETAQRLAESVSKKLHRDFLPSMKKVINATGIILHTNLGRAPLSDSALKKMNEISGGYMNLEISLENGKRSDRNQHIEELLKALTGAESAAIVNNNAAAVLLAINTFAYRKECIISRGQLVEIGGSFRMPDVMERAGTKMIEIGTTNRTHLKDFENAINEKSGAIILVHTSNYKISGFTKFPEHKEIVELAHKHSIPVIFDLGSGALTDLTRFGLPGGELVSEVVKRGIDLVTFSGDKLLGGPQAGLLVGSKTVIDKCKENPLMRVLRCDKVTLTAMEETLKLFAEPEKLSETHASYTLFSTPLEELKKRAENAIANLNKKSDEYSIEIREVTGEAGSGSLPVAELASIAICLKSETDSVETVSKKFRSLETPIIGYINNDTFFLDMRAIFAGELKLFSDSINEVIGSG